MNSSVIFTYVKFLNELYQYFDCSAIFDITSPHYGDLMPFLYQTSLTWAGQDCKDEARCGVGVETTRTHPENIRSVFNFTVTTRTHPANIRSVFNFTVTTRTYPANIRSVFNFTVTTRTHPANTRSVFNFTASLRELTLQIQGRCLTSPSLQELTLQI